MHDHVDKYGCPCGWDISCQMCGNDADTLADIEKLDIKVFGRIPIRDVVQMWYKKGFKPETRVCQECILQ